MIITTIIYLVIIYVFAIYNKVQILDRWGDEDYKAPFVELWLRGFFMFAYAMVMTILYYHDSLPAKAALTMAVFLVLAMDIWWIFFDQLLKVMLNKKQTYMGKKFLDRIFPNFYWQLAAKVLIIAGCVVLIVWI